MMIFLFSNYKTREEVKDFIKKLANLDFQIKSGQIEALMVLELLILNT